MWSQLDPGTPTALDLAPLRAGGQDTASRRTRPHRSRTPNVSTYRRDSTMTTTITTEANLTADPELRFTKNTGQAVATVRLAASTRRKNIDGEYQDTAAVFYEATLRGSLAENAAISLHKGDRVLAQGTSYDEEWTDREGQTRVKHVLQVTLFGASLRYATAVVTRTGRTSDQAEYTPAQVG
jgi:single-strand DNA-binding protein